MGMSALLGFVSGEDLGSRGDDLEGQPMNKRQRKKADKRAMRENPMYWLMGDGRLFYVSYAREQLAQYLRAQDVVMNTPRTSAVLEPNSWTPDGIYPGPNVSMISPSARSNREFPTIYRGFARCFDFARCFSGDQSRRDSFPSPYLPDGSENPEYSYLTQHSRWYKLPPLEYMLGSRT